MSLKSVSLLTVLAQLALASLSTLSFAAGSAQTPVDVRAVGPRNGVRAIVQDSRHYIWTAGDRGVCRFDALSWGCPVTEASAVLAADRNGGIWIGSTSGSISRIAPGSVKADRFAQTTNLVSLNVDESGFVLIGTDQGLFELDLSSGRLRDPAIITGAIAAVAEEQTGSLLVASGRQLFRVRKRLANKIWQSRDTIRTVTASPIGAIALGLNDATVVKLRTTADGYSAQQLPVPPNMPLGPMTIDGSERLWIGDRDSILFLGPGDLASTPVKFRLSTSTFQVNTMMPDHEGSLWIGTATGLLQLKFDQLIRPLSFERSSTQADFVFSVEQAKTGEIWMATLPGVSRWNGGLFKDYAQKEGLVEPDLRSVAIDPVGSVFVAGMNTGVFRLRNDRFESIKTLDGKRSPGASALRARLHGGVWVGPTVGGLGVIKDNVFEWLIIPSTTGSNRAVDMAEAANGTLWVATASNGLIAWRDGISTQFAVDVGLSRFETLCMYASPDGAIWIGTDGDGLFHFDGKRARRISLRHGLDDEHVLSIIEDARGNLWLGSPRGLSVASKSSINDVLEGRASLFTSAHYGASDGVLGEPIHGFPPSATTAIDGSLLIATAQGVISVSPSLLPKETSPQVFVDGITIDQREFPVGRSIRANVSGNAELTVEFSAPTFRAPQRLRFRYKLEGLDRKWNETAVGNIRLERIPVGHYQLLLQAYFPGVDLDHLKLTKIEFDLQPPWHGRVIVRIGAVFLMLLFVVLAIRMRRAKFEQMQAAILAERARIAHDIHDGLEQDLSGLRLQIEAAGQTLATSPEKARACLERAGALIGDASVDLRLAIWKLQLDATSSAEVFNSLEQRLRRATADTTVKLEMTMQGPSRALPVGVATHLVSIAREGVANAIKHASATQITLTLCTVKANEVVLEVRDNGHGVVKPKSVDKPLASGLGVSGMKARARALNGSLELFDVPEGGTLLRFTAPLRR